jgi:FixJ family two-component response regulator
MVPPIKIAVIDDDESARTSLARLIKSAGLEASTFASAVEFLDSPFRSQTDCLVTDLRMPGLDGLKLQERIGQELPDLSVVFLTGHGNVSTSVHALKAGAVDFLEKPVDEIVLLETIQRAAEQSQRCRAARKELEALRHRHASLTPRERQVFALVTSGLLNKQIGAELGATERTIKAHRGRVMDKMKADSLAALVLMAQRLAANADSTRFQI